MAISGTLRSAPIDERVAVQRALGSLSPTACARPGRRQLSAVPGFAARPIRIGGVALLGGGMVLRHRSHS